MVETNYIFHYSPHLWSKSADKKIAKFSVECVKSKLTNREHENSVYRSTGCCCCRLRSRATWNWSKFCAEFTPTVHNHDRKKDERQCGPLCSLCGVFLHFPSLSTSLHAIFIVIVISTSSCGWSSYKQLYNNPPNVIFKGKLRRKNVDGFSSHLDYTFVDVVI